MQEPGWQAQFLSKSSKNLLQCNPTIPDSLNIALLRDVLNIFIEVLRYINWYSCWNIRAMHVLAPMVKLMAPARLPPGLLCWPFLSRDVGNTCLTALSCCWS